MTETERAWTSYILLGDYEYVSLQEAEARAALVGKLEQKAVLAAEVAKELHDREKLSAVDAILFPRLTDYEQGWLDRFDAAEVEKEAGK